MRAYRQADPEFCYFRELVYRARQVDMVSIAAMAVSDFRPRL
jgi:hypothetical protein